MTPLSPRSSLPLQLSASLLLSLAAVPAFANDDEKKWDVNDPPGDEYEIRIDTTEGTWMGLDVSPDGERIVFDLLGDLYLLPIGGGDAEALTNGMAWDMMPRFSPDGSRVAFISDRSGGDNVWTIPVAGGEPKQISREDFRLVNNPVWSPDGRFIAARKHFVSTRSIGSGEIWLYHASGEGSGLQLNEKPNEQKDLGEPAFSPDGRYVYFSQDTTPGGVYEYGRNAATGIYSIRRIDRETGEIETVIAGPGGAVRPTPSPDGRYLAFVRRIRFRSHLFLHDLRSGENTAIHDALDRDMQEIWAVHGVYPGMAWTPDSGSVVFWARGGLHRIDIETREVGEIPFRVRATHRMQEALAFDFEATPDTFRTKMLRWISGLPRRRPGRVPDARPAMDPQPRPGDRGGRRGAAPDGPGRPLRVLPVVLAGRDSGSSIRAGTTTISARCGSRRPLAARAASSRRIPASTSNRPFRRTAARSSTARAAAAAC